VKICPLCSTEYRDDVRFCPNDGQTLRSSGPVQDLVGQVLADRYHIKKKLGEGGMGQVYLAEHVKMGRRSAIKVMNPSMAHDPEAVARFNREAANASRISDSHVCAIYDFGETPEGLIYLAMEFVEGEPLTHLLAREGALPVARAAGIATQVAAALQAAHDLGIVHRDLKPDNIMLTRGREGADAVKVVDFGIAKTMGAEGSQQVTRTGLVVGTPEFMSPEQLSGDKLDGRSDVYSLGLVLFKMLTGALPFPGDSVQEAMIKRLTDQPWELIEVRPDLHFPPGLQETLDAALARTPVDRYQSAAKFAHDLATVVGLSPITVDTPLPGTRADPDDSTELLQPVRTRRRARVPMLVGVVVALGAAGAVVTVGRHVRETGSVPPPDTARYVAVPRPVDTSSRVPVVPPRREPVNRPRAPASRPRIDVARARDLLDDLLFKLSPLNAAMVRDSATHLFYAPGIGSTDRAHAAFVLGNAFFQQFDRQRGCEWLEAAVRLDSANPSYRDLARQCRRT
jgi:eukaryotic-like serine/threonine-protein kinase